jgi:hypothetical protein
MAIDQEHLIYDYITASFKELKEQNEELRSQLSHFKKVVNQEVDEAYLNQR